MARFLARRIAETIALLMVVAFASFCLGEWAPGTFDATLRLEPGYSPDAVAAVRARNGLDRPLIERFGAWLASVGRGEFGRSIEYDAPIAPLVFARAGRTLLLAAGATALAWILALPLGVWMAASAGSSVERAASGAVTCALAVPEPVLALVAVMIAARTGLAPAGGMWSIGLDSASHWSRADVADLARHLALPVVVLTLGLLPVLVRHVRANLVEALDSRFIAAARARGVPRRRLLFRSALRVAATPLAALLGLSMANLLSMSLLVEVVTGWPGLGPLLVEATRSRDVPVVAGVALCSCVVLAAGCLVSDVGAQLLDPRVRVAAAPRAE